MNLLLHDGALRYIISLFRMLIDDNNIGVANANHIIAILRGASPQAIGRLTGYVVYAQTIDPDGRLHSHTVRPVDQDIEMTEQLIADGHEEPSDR